jgi:hypothetical protein
MVHALAALLAAIPRASLNPTLAAWYLRPPFRSGFLLWKKLSTRPLVTAALATRAPFSPIHGPGFSRMSMAAPRPAWIAAPQSTLPSILRARDDPRSLPLSFPPS